MARNCLCLLLAAGCAMACLPTAVSAQSVAATSNQDTLTEIIVTATKRDEKAQDVPTAMSALGSPEIQTLGIQSFRDYEDLVPGLSQRDEGAPGIGTVILRGLNTGSEQSSNTAAFYLDDAPFSASGYSAFGDQITPDPDLLDVDRIEVLKGPQGTLYGAGSLGGLVRIISKKPSLEDFSASVNSEGVSLDGGASGASVRGSVSVPLVPDELAVRASAVYRHLPGYVDNVGTGHNNVNDGTIKGGRFAVLARPADNLSIEFVGLVQDISVNGFDYQYNITDTATPLYGDRKFSDFFDPTSSSSYRLASTTINYDLHAGSLIATASYATFTGFRDNDNTSQQGPVPGLPADEGIATSTGPDIKKFSSEIRFVSKRIGPVEYLAGFFYTNEHNGIPYAIRAYDRDTLVPLPAPLNLLFAINRHSNYVEHAGFGDLTYYLTERLDVTGGVRYSQNHENASDYFTGLLNGPPSTALYNFSGSDTTYLATLRWRPTDTLSTYLRAASGYRPGGPQLNSVVPPGAQKTISPDTDWNYEAGVKGSFYDGALRADFDVYHIDWKNVQLNSTCCGGFIFTGNAGAAKVDGLELELEARPIKNLTLGFTAGYTNARITQISASTSATIGADAGNALPLTPKYAAALTADYIVPLSNGVQASFGGTVRYRGIMNSSYPGDLINPDVIVPKYLPVDIRAGLKYAKYTVQFRVENVGNSIGYSTIETAKAFPYQPDAETIATVLPPRSYILSLTVDF
jgi:iron complex outermembrane receptor protein